MQFQTLKVILWILLFSSFFGIFTPHFALFPVILSFLFTLRVLVLKIPGKFKKELVIYILFYLASAVSCLVYEKQALSFTFSAADSILYYSVLSYFVFISGKYGLKTMERALFIGNCLFLCCFFVQLVAMPNVVFCLATDYTEIGRFTMMGQLIAYFFLFYCYSKYLFEKKNKYLYLCVPSLLVMLEAGFRTQLATIVLLLAVMTSLIKKTATAKYVIIFSILAVILYQVPLVQNSIGNMLERQAEGATFQNKDYIRLVQFEYFTQHHFKSPVEYVFGSGVPNPRSIYGAPFYTVDPTIGPYNGWRDWGLVGLSWITGLFTVICLLIPVIRIIFTKCDSRMLYFKFFYLFLLCSSFTTVEFFRTGSFFFHGFIFYFYELNLRKYNQLNNG